MNTLKLFTSPVGLALLPTITKSVGSVFRSTVDYRNAPPDVYRNEIKREVSLLSLAFASNLAIQLVAASTFPRLLPKVFPKIAKEAATLQAVNLLSRFALTVPATVLAEGLSRIIGKPPTWDEGEEREDRLTPVEEENHYRPENHRDDEDEKPSFALPATQPTFVPRSFIPPALPVPLMAGPNPFAAAQPSLGYHAPQPASLTPALAGTI